MSKIVEVPSKVYINALVVSSIPTAASVLMNVRRQETNGDVEYTNIASLWHKPCDVPKDFPCVLITRYTYYKDEEDVYLTTSVERFVSERDFTMNFGEVKNAVSWCNVNDILPKGGEQ